MMRKTLLLALFVAAIALAAWLAGVADDAPAALAVPADDRGTLTASAAITRRDELAATRSDASKDLEPRTADRASHARRSSALPEAGFVCRGDVFEWIDGGPEPYLGAAIHLALEVDGREVWSTEVQAVDGSYEVAVPAGGLRAESEPMVVLHARAPLHLPMRFDTPLAFRGLVPTPMRVEVRLGPSAPVLRGRVLDPSGDPVENPAIEVWRVDGAEPELEFGPYTETGLYYGRGYRNGEAHGDPGEYAVQVSPAAVYQIAVQHESLGVGVVGPLIVGEADRVLPDLVLRGTGSLEGRVLFPDGEPAPQFRLRLELAEPPRMMDGTRVEMGAQGLEPAYAILELAGLPGASVMTDREGRFRFGGLGPWPYRLSGTEGAIVLAGAGPHRTSLQNLDVVMAMYVVRVRVIADDGSVPTNARLGHRSWSDPVASLRADVRSPGFRESAHAPDAARSGTEEQGSWWTLAQPGELLRFDAAAPGYLPQFAILEVLRDRYEYSVTLELARDDRPTAEVFFDLSSYPLLPRPHAELISRETGIAHRVGASGSFNFDARRNPPEFALRAGTYDLHIAQSGDTGLVFPLDETIEVIAGSPLTLRPEFRVGGRLDLEGKLAERSVHAVSVDLEWLPAEGKSHRSTVRIAPGGTRLQARLGVLEPGPGVLRVLVPGREPVEMQLEVRAGEATQVTLDLGR